MNTKNTTVKNMSTKNKTNSQHTTSLDYGLNDTSSDDELELNIYNMYKTPNKKISASNKLIKKNKNKRRMFQLSDSSDESSNSELELELNTNKRRTPNKQQKCNTVEKNKHKKEYVTNSDESNEENSDENNYEKTTCIGCKDDQPNQLAHMEKGGCLYINSDIEDEMEDEMKNNLSDNLQIVYNTMIVKYPTYINKIYDICENIDDNIEKKNNEYSINTIANKVEIFLKQKSSLIAEKCKNELMWYNAKNNFKKDIDVSNVYLFDIIDDLNCDELNDLEEIIKLKISIKELDEDIVTKDVYHEYWKHRGHLINDAILTNKN